MRHSTLYLNILRHQNNRVGAALGGRLQYGLEVGRAGREDHLVGLDFTVRPTAQSHVLELLSAPEVFECTEMKRSS